MDTQKICQLFKGTDMRPGLGRFGTMLVKQQCSRAEAMQPSAGSLPIEARAFAGLRHEAASMRPKLVHSARVPSSRSAAAYKGLMGSMQLCSLSSQEHTNIQRVAASAAPAAAAHTSTAQAQQYGRPGPGPADTASSNCNGNGSQLPLIECDGIFELSIDPNTYAATRRSCSSCDPLPESFQAINSGIPPDAWQSLQALNCIAAYHTFASSSVISKSKTAITALPENESVGSLQIAIDWRSMGLSDDAKAKLRQHANITTLELYLEDLSCARYSL